MIFLTPQTCADTITTDDGALIPRPPHVLTDAGASRWTRFAYGCERCSGGGNTSSSEALSDPDSTTRVTSSCQSCGGLGYNA